MSHLKAIAMYLPQFYQNSLNDKWWGNGYTDWEAVKNADKLFSEHKQPRIPLNNWYYDLSQKETMIKQAELARKYNVYGFCFYHYWFQKNVMALELPAENLLMWNDVNMNFCFSWANVTWATTWNKMNSSKNVWSDKFEKCQVDENGQSIIREQQYGDVEDWKSHFEYLIKFFLDKRYIKIDNKPVFVIYKCNDFPMLQPMLRMWNKWAKRYGFDGIYIIAEACNEYSGEISAIMQHEPEYSKGYIRKGTYTKEGEVIKYNYDEIWEEVITARTVEGKGKAYYMAFTDFDNSPRKGIRGELMCGVTVDKFEEYFNKLVQKSIERNNEIIFINAWNEWGEGMYLEPDTESGFGWLNAVKRIMDDAEEIELVENKSGISENLKKDRNQEIVKALDKILSIYEQNQNISIYFSVRNYKKLAIYGYGILGKHFINLISESSDIEICYIIDKNIKSKINEYPVYSLEDEWPEVDAVIVTVTWQFNNIEEFLFKRGMKRVISLQAVLDIING